MTTDTTSSTQARIVADPTLPVIRITREFRATPAQLLRAHTDPELYARWVGPADLTTRIDYWDARRGGRWRFTQTRGTDEFGFYGSFHEIADDHLVQTFTWEGMPDGVSLETIRFVDLGDGRTRLEAQSLVDSFESRDAWLSMGMQEGVQDGYAKLDALLAAQEV